MAVMPLIFQVAAVMGSAGLGLAEVPVLTGMSRHLGLDRAYFETPDHQVAFSLTVGGEWGNYRLVAVDFTHRLASLEENGLSMVVQFGGGAETSAPASAESTKVPPTRRRSYSPFTEEEEQFRAVHGQAAFAKWQNDRFLVRFEAEQAAKRGELNSQKASATATP